MPFQKEPEPTAPGIRSEASNRTVSAAAASPAIVRSNGTPYQSSCTSFCGPSAPPAASQPFTPSPVEKNCMTAQVSGCSVVAAMMSPATRNGLPYCASTPGR